MIQLPARYAQEMIEHARAGAPQEVCGILAGRQGRVVKLYRTRNVAEQPLVTYRMEPHEQLRIFRDIDEQGWEILGIYHSHPATEAYPSATDMKLAFYPDSLYFIVSLARQKPVIRAFRINQERGEIQEEEVVIVGGDRL
ncbi:MAG: Mov34/MPN/PAD-1 family protein [Anaerolineae bacterium]